jgi:site-specific recombinase XerD
VVFHTLRACFATHLLASGAEAAKVMAIGGWKDYKTFQIYLRLAGVETAGTTEKLSVLPRLNALNLLVLKNS